MIYEPAEDSFLLAKEVKKEARGKRVLDMGTGSGILAEAARDAGAASVLAADIDRNAVHKLAGRGIAAVQSDLFENIEGEFDLIIFNPPYLPQAEGEDKESRRITTGGKKGDELALRFLRGAKQHLSAKGEILLLLSTLTPRKSILSLLRKRKMKKEVVASQKLFMEALEVWKITNL